MTCCLRGWCSPDAFQLTLLRSSHLPFTPSSTLPAPIVRSFMLCCGKGIDSLINYSWCLKWVKSLAANQNQPRMWYDWAVVLVLASPSSSKVQLQMIVEFKCPLKSAKAPTKNSHVHRRIIIGQALLRLSACFVLLGTFEPLKSIVMWPSGRWVFLMFSIFQQLDLHNEICVALATHISMKHHQQAYWIFDWPPLI